MCLHRTRADQVARVIRPILDFGGTPESFVANSKKLQPYLSTLGLGWRSENLTSAAEYIVSRFNQQVPKNWPDLMSIPGVGDYIASAVQCFVFDRSSVLLDTNTKRIAQRVLGAEAHVPTWKLRLFLRELAGNEGANTKWNYALLDLGALVCKSRSPLCGECPVRVYCKTGREVGREL